jgi:hypothetical protein
VLVFGAPKIVAFWNFLVSPHVLSRKTWEKIRARGLRTLPEYKISLFGPQCSVGITKNYILQLQTNPFLHIHASFHTFSSAFEAVWIIRKIASVAFGKRFDFLLGN